MELKTALSEYDYLFKPENFIDELSKEKFVIDPCDGSRLLIKEDKLFSIESTIFGYSDFSGFEAQKITESQWKTNRCPVKLIKIPYESNVSIEYKKYINRPRDLVFSQHQIIDFCEKYRQWFKEHIRLLYVITNGGFVLVSEDFTFELGYSFKKIKSLYQTGRESKGNLAFFLKMDHGTIRPQ